MGGCGDRSRRWRWNCIMLRPDPLFHPLFHPFDPNLQRWINRDPVEESGGINLYLFSGNSALNSVDPWGETVMLWQNNGSGGLGIDAQTAAAIMDGFVTIYADSDLGWAEWVTHEGQEHLGPNGVTIASTTI